ncbi:DNA-dependent metalloprotease SPRTN-like isoform X2 [Homarus americanus]|uniref:DNA-dependent metalloprotease SPRTN-like isoform X2 n=1 Tax=Homarus americanus TaxID=6706 RepID=UPI001C48BE69|nr:DNA-dependent metalloprotease SPRTN-like isoform X2 [Homarus americanus]
MSCVYYRCAGKTSYSERGHSHSSCRILLSQPLLSQRPRSDTVNTLLHEMIHAFLHVTQGLNYRDSHGPEFRKHMKRINDSEGSKITISHNFRKEVDKFRIHVYRCDGPCTTRRPYFGLLRRAIKRPPGPGDKWWARHQQECGGTFRKIEGPGADPLAGSITDKVTKQLNQSKMSNSPKVRGIHNKATNSTRQCLKSSGTRKSYDEDEVLQRIKRKYSNVKRSILLSKKETKKAISVNQEKRWKKGKGCIPEVGNPVNGNVNYNYISKIPLKLELKKYLNRYREAKSMESQDSHVPRESKVTNPRGLNYEKYLNRFCRAKNTESCVSSTSNVDSHTSSLPVTLKDSTSSCPICNTLIPATEYDQHLQECFGDDLDLEMDESFEEEKYLKIDHSPKIMTEASRKVGNDCHQQGVRKCQNCGSLVYDAELTLHLKYCM